MNWHKAVRRLGAIAAVTALTSAAALPAAAQTGPVSIELAFADTVVPAGGSNAEAGVSIQASRDASLEDLTFTFDVSGLTGVATLDSAVGYFPCTTSGTEVVCSDSFPPTDVSTEPGRALPLEITADPAAVAGATATVPVTAEATGIDPVTAQATVTIGAPVDLVADGSDDELTVAPGETLSLPWTVRNAGPEPAQGVTLWVFTDFTLRPQGQYGNCVSVGNVFYGDEVSGLLCTFDVVLEPGTDYILDRPLAIEVGADAPAPSSLGIGGTWLTRTQGAVEAAAVAARGRTLEPGTGPALGLVEVGGGAPAAAPADPLPAADIAPGNDWITVSVETEGDNPPDFAAVGAALTGAAGDLVTAEVGLENVGPAAAVHTRSGEPVNYVRVTLPEGTTAVEVPAACSPVTGDGYDPGRAGAPGEPAYICVTGFLLPAGESESFPIVLRIDQVVPDATGVVEVNQVVGPSMPPDTNTDNDVAEILVNATDGGGSGGGGGGGLPVTGPAAGTLAGAGVLLIALGGAGVLLLRRRRTRFVA